MVPHKLPNQRGAVFVHWPLAHRTFLRRRYECSAHSLAAGLSSPPLRLNHVFALRKKSATEAELAAEKKTFFAAFVSKTTWHAVYENDVMVS